MVPLFDPGPIEHPGIPVHIAAIGPNMCAVAGEGRTVSVSIRFALLVSSMRRFSRTSRVVQRGRAEMWTK